MSDSDHNNNSSDNLPETKNEISSLDDNVTNTESTPKNTKQKDFCVHPGFKQKHKPLKMQKLKGKKSSGQLPSLIIPPKINEQKPQPSPEITARWKSMAKKATNPILNPDFSRKTIHSGSQQTAPAAMNNSFPFRKNPLHRSLSKRISKQALSPQSSHSSMKFQNLNMAGSASFFSPNRQRQTSNFSDQSQNNNNRVPNMNNFMDVVKAAVVANTPTPEARIIHRKQTTKWKTLQHAKERLQKNKNKLRLCTVDFLDFRVYVLCKKCHFL